jgi:hypothetical protein
MGELASADESEAAGTSGVSLIDGLLKGLRRSKFRFSMKKAAREKRGSEGSRFPWLFEGGRCPLHGGDR